VDPFRYEQFCPLARATEILGHRWVLLILRELFVGPQRFSDLRRRLRGVSSSVLTDRLAALEEQGVVARRELSPPAASSVYELTSDGRALEPALLALVRWGARLILPPTPGDHAEPDWLVVGAEAFARKGPTPHRRFELRVRSVDSEGVESEAVVRVAGGPEGTSVIDDDLPVDASIQAPVMVVMGLMSGALPAAEALANGAVTVEGDAEVLSDLPALFEIQLERETQPERETQKGASP
jgi:DNA-binding HxlR family transcriptional regulator